MANLSEYDVSKQFEAKVKASTRLTPAEAKEEVRNIVLEFAKPAAEPRLGQSVGVLVPGPHEFGNPYHLRLYSIAGMGTPADDTLAVELCVRRCFYVDEFSGERFPGVASNYLCDRKPGDTVTLTGPYSSPFAMPEDAEANLLMIGMGTGVAPFRAFVKRIYEAKGGWKGQVRLFYGARTGLEMLYLNDEKDDFANYYDEATFKAFKAVSPRPALDAPAALGAAVERNGAEVWSLVLDPNTYVYVAGLAKAREQFDAAMAKLAGSADKWERRKNELRAGGRYAELIY